MSKYEEIKVSFSKKLKEILSNKEEFIQFIKFYSKFYKYDFQDSLCIYVQKENATAVAPYDTWKMIKYQVKKGEKGIGLFDDSTFSKLRYVFDVSSTYQQKINLWQYIEDKHKDIVDLNFSKDKFKQKYSLENIEDKNLKDLIFYMNLIAKNIRLGLEAKDYTDIVEKTLPKIKIQDVDIFFNELCSSISNDLLEIENSIKLYERNLIKQKEEKEQKPDVPFFNTQNNENKPSQVTIDDLAKDENNIVEIKIENTNSSETENNNEEIPIKYNIGNTIVLDEMIGENLPYGLKGTIKKIDSVGQIHISWENGSTLAIDPKIDKFEVLQNKSLNLEEDKNKTSSFLSLNFNIHSKKAPYPTTTNEKIQANIDAIKMLIKIESEKRVARAEEKEILANYVGFGGLPQVFENPEKIESPFIREKAIELKEILTDKEYEMARASTLNAHYTPNEVIDEIYRAINGFGYNNNIKILEPSCGTGNFIGNLPENLINSNVTGVELDSLTGRIAKQLYPNARIKINGFENEYFNKNSFDLVVGNVPFGDYRIYDKEYNKNNYLIHDYFINKSIELTKPNGIVAVITSKGTLDKKDDSFRREIAKKAELVGAIRLPNTTFKKLANTEVVSDILFFQKLEKEREEVPEWVNTTEVKYENRINNYFATHPEMILGELDYKTNRYGGYDLTVNSTSENLVEDLKQAVENLPKNIVNNELLLTNDDIINEDNGQNDKDIDYLLHQHNYRIYRYAYYTDKIFYKYSNNHIEQVNVKNKDRVIGMIKIRDLAKEIIDVQLDTYTYDIETFDELFNKKLKEFNRIYDEFVSKYGYINSRINISAFKEDDDIHFLTSLEKSVDGKYEKTKFFFQKTIAPNIEIESVDNVKDALVLSLNKYGNINFEYMQKLYDKQINEIIDELVQGDFIYLNPLNYSKEDITKGWEVKSIYLNGNVKNKLKIVEELKDESPYFQRNIEKLKEVIPKDVDFSDIKIDIGSDLYKPEDMKAFAKKILNLYSEPDIRYNEKTSEWKIYNKTVHNYLATQEYGTNRIGALYIFEKILNNTEIVVKDEVEDSEGRKRYVQNKEETIKATEKKMLIEREFEEFIHQNKEIRDRIMKEYNERFNNSINANFDLELTLPNLSPDIKLRPHQKRAVARSIFNPNNLLLDHQVGAGKTFIMIVSAMENKRLGRANKPLLVVPNNIMGQFKNDFYLLYPNANILYADEKSFETKNRKRFLSKIAQNEYDAVIMGQSQFDLLKISKGRQIEYLQTEIEQIVEEISDLNSYEDRISIKSLERTKKALEKSLKKLMDSKEESILDFEQLGVDALYLDEAHLYKNLYFVTKLRNIAGINQTASQRATNLKMKIEYLEEIGGKVTFATGTPISNTMAEMYTMQRYLMQNTLREQGIYNFDSWQKIFASTQTKLEVSPTGNGFQLKTRFANFRNIPELMKLYNSVADVVSNDMINLPIPKYTNEVLEAETSEELAKEMKSFGERAEKCKNGSVNPKDDNMLKIVNEGRYAGLDIRHINENNPDYENSKVNLVVNKVVEIYNQTMENKSTQVIFSDLSTPKDDEFNVYDDIKNKLIQKGIKEDEIAFVHTAKNSKQREDMFEKVRTGDIRVILGSTTKMGAGTNFQNKLVALYHLDTPWRPSDLEQREGRILRQGNENEEVKIFRCITKGSFDAYSWQILEQKQRFITQAKVGAITGREVKDIDDVTLDYAEIKALATGNPKIKRKMEIDTEIEKIRVLETAYRKKQYSSENFLNEIYPKELERFNNRIERLKLDDEYIKTLGDLSSDENFEITIKDNKYTDKEKAGAFLIQVANASGFGDLIGEYKGFKIYSNSTQLSADIKLKHNASHRLTLNNGYKKANIDLLDECILSIDKRIEIADKNIKDLQEQKEQVEKFYNTPFEHKETLENLLKEKIELEKEFENENKTCVQFEDDNIKEEKILENKILDDEIEL
ncbi:DUF4314 domain-containing protein [uncultured Tyzzerella sp.]|uniref:DUF4314 domain-containing protein n=1 Tax=uncultured Tyzzerella sp. TaxID=2321398 RepID=UPI002941EED7|nr:DUF4314 domain-containing protein [uncultured Tyzzerella sp.]